MTLYLKNERLIISLAMALLLVGDVSAQEKLSDADKQAATEWIKQAKESYQSANMSRIRKAESALSAACVSESAAMGLYMDAMKARMMDPNALNSQMSKHPGGMRMMMMGAGKAFGRSSKSGAKPASPSAQFSEWRKQNSGSNLKPGFKKALVIQFKWMLLCLKKANAEKQEQEMDVTGSVMSFLNEVSASAPDITDQMWQVGSVSGTVRDYLGISDYRSQTMPESAFDVSGIYERLLLPPYQESKDVVGFRNMWQKRINSEMIMLKAASEVNGKDSKKPDIATINMILKRQIDQERACFEMGDEVQAISNIKRIITQMKDPADKQQALSLMESILKGEKKEKEDRFDRRGNRPSRI